ncbi:MAG: carboxypeptidase M32 [Candidatus Dormibacteraeota bacterium]|nr:carboxypeptidase M32 [Candidatus Dormibacteraeota bacterium]
MATALTQLREVLVEVANFDEAAELLTWDAETYMPPGGVAGRSALLATLRRHSHDLFTGGRVLTLLDRAENEVAGLAYESDDASLVRITRRDNDRKRRIPSDLVAAKAEASGTAAAVWREARERADFALFAPHLAANVEMSRRLADAIGYEDRPYDALLFREPGISTAQLEAIFGELKASIVPLLRQIANRADQVDAGCLHGDFAEEAQLRVSEQMAAGIGYQFANGRQDRSAHPFTCWMNPGDVRITTRVAADYLPMCLFGSLHEAGHAMYALGHAPELAGSPLWIGASPGFHESQSRLYENLIGRSRPFWRRWFPELVKAFPEHFAGVDAEQWYRAVNQVRPSLIRVEADEVTYNLHILLRFELECELLDGKLRVDEVPAAWNAKMEEYLGVEPTNAALGPLQDIHWTFIGSLGSFPAYTLGNLIGAQLMERLRTDLPALDAQLEEGDHEQLLGWLRHHVHIHGRKFTPAELLMRVTGRELEARPWIEYVQAKFGELYGIRPPAEAERAGGST